MTNPKLSPVSPRKRAKSKRKERGKKIENVINLIRTKASFKVTLGGCIIKKVNETVILSKE